VASLNVEILRAAMGAVTGLADAYARDAASWDEPRDSEAQRIVALRASAPASAELQASMNDLALALHEASTAVAHVSSLVAPDDLDGACDIATVVAEVAQLVRIVVERVAEFRLELPRDDACPARLPRSILVQALSALLTNALQAVRDRADRRVITLRVESRVAVGIIEVIDNGLGLGPTALERALETPPSARGTAAPTGLAMVAERVRRAGGEIMLESEPGLGTTVRLFVPLLLRSETPDLTAN
jgi:signal transduction histidine kinase